MKALVLYHDNCPDGFTAAWAAWKALGDEAEYRGVNYGQPLPEDLDGRKHVVLVDFSYPLAEMNDLASRTEHVTVFDHHKTAEEVLRYWGDEAPETRRVVFDMNRSGAGITWDELHPSAENWMGIRPALISYVEDRDLWRWLLPSSREISEYLFSYAYTFEAWDQLDSELGPNVTHSSSTFLAAVKAGEALLRAKRQRLAQVCKNARWVTLAGQRVPVVNHAWDMSELGEYLAEANPQAPCGGYYFDRVDQRQWGLRSRNGFDVSTIAKAYGGGGHAAAAGFQSAIGWLGE